MTPEQDARLREEVEKLAERMAVSSHTCTQHCEYREDCGPMVDRAAGAIAQLLLPYAQAAEERAERALEEGKDAGATIMAGMLRRRAEGLPHTGTFVGEEIEAAAQAIVALRAERDALQQRVAELKKALRMARIWVDGRMLNQDVMAEIDGALTPTCPIHPNASRDAVGDGPVGCQECWKNMCAGEKEPSR